MQNYKELVSDILHTTLGGLRDENKYFEYFGYH